MIISSPSFKSCPLGRRCARCIAYFGLLVLVFSIQLVASACFVNIRSGNRCHRLAQTSKPNHRTCLALGKYPLKSDRPKIHHPSHTTNRRIFLQQPLLLILLTGGTDSNAACLPGDIRSECIGVYKMPLDDAALPYVETPEQLKKFAPDLNWVPPIEYPKTYAAAVTQIQQQSAKLDAVKELILKGDLNQGGLLLLDVVPKISSAGKVVLVGLGIAVNKERNLDMKQNKDGSIDGSSEKATSLDMKTYRFEYAMNELLGYLGETDVLIGQGLRGQLGVSAPAQIQILASLDEARREFDEMMSVIPDKI